jgi:hypothetical protein
MSRRFSRSFGCLALGLLVAPAAQAFVPAHFEPVEDIVRFTSGIDVNGPHLTKVEARNFGFADVDADGHVDVLFGYEEDTGNISAPKVSRIEVRRGASNGVFYLGARYSFGSGVSAEDLDLSRIVGGAFDDAPGAEVAAIARASGDVVVLSDYSLPPPHFSGELRISPRYPAVDLAAADLNADGSPELVVLEREPMSGMGRSAVSVYAGAGMRRVTSVSLPRDMNPVALAAGDLDGDGLVEIVVAGGGDGLAASVSDALVVLRNQTASAGSRPRFALTSYAGTPAADLALGGFDADSQALDVAVLAAEAAGAAPFVRLNDGTGLLGDERPTAGAGLLLALDSGNLNGDGTASEDLLAFNDDQSALASYYNIDGLGTFELDPAGAPVDLWFADFAVADVNGDGLDDRFVLSDRGTNRQFDTALGVALNVTDLDWLLTRSSATEAVVAEWEAINAGTNDTCTDYFTGWFDGPEGEARRTQIRAEAESLPFYSLGQKLIDSDGDGIFEPYARVATFVGGTACSGGYCLLTEVDVDVSNPANPIARRVLVECD